MHCIQQKHSAWYACIDSIECECSVEFSLPAVYLYCTLWSTFSFNVWYNLFTLNFLNVTNLSIATSQSIKLLKMNFVVFFMTRE